jgi:hypothetical protein
MEATGATTTTDPAGERQETQSHDRLAELVVHLTDCPAPLAIAAVNEAAGDDELVTEDDRLMVVARAMLSVKRGIDLRG